LTQEWNTTLDMVSNHVLKVQCRLTLHVAFREPVTGQLAYTDYVDIPNH